MKLSLKKKAWSIKPCYWSCGRELTLLGGKYTLQCPKCKKDVIYQSDEILIDPELGGKHWICISAHCVDCDHEWEEERQIEVQITAQLL